MQRRIGYASIAAGLVLGGHAAAAPSGEVDLRRLGAVVVPDPPHALEQEMAKLLVEKLDALYGVKPAVTNASRTGEGAILLGREHALASGLINQTDLEAVKDDGFVIRTGGGRVAIAGWEPQGTVFGTWAFLRHAGLRTYPCRDLGHVEILEPRPGGKLPALSESSRPFFHWRAILNWLDRGRWGASLLSAGGLGDFAFAREHEYFKGKDWLGNDHTAPYLVPMGKYHDAHPEYFAMHGGKRLPKDTKNMRVTLCTSNPDVPRIAAERMIEWIGLQRDKRFFFLTDGDSGACRCPACVALDPLPDRCTRLRRRPSRRRIRCVPVCGWPC